MGKMPKSTANQSQLNKEIEQILVGALRSLYPGTQVKVKNLDMRYEQLDPPALDVSIRAALEIVVIPDLEEEVP